MTLLLKEQATRLIYQYSVTHYENIVPMSFWDSYYGKVPAIRLQWYHDTVNTPNFRLLTNQQKRSLPFHDYVLTKSERIYDQVTRITRQEWDANYYGLAKGTATSLLGNISGGPGDAAILAVPPPDEEFIVKTKTKVRDKVAGAHVNLAQAFAERQQVERMFIRTAAAIKTSLIALKRGNYVSAVKALGLEVTDKDRKFSWKWHRAFHGVPTEKSVGSAWLELQYGWKPLLSDIYASAELLAERMRKQESVCTVRQTASKSTSTSYTLSPFAGASAGSISKSDNQRCLIYLDYTVDDDTARVLGKTGLTNPLLLAWELVPYSFVVDWFFPLGNWLESFTAFDGLVFRGGYINLKRRTVWSGNGGSTGFSPAGYSYAYSGSLLVKNYYFGRKKLNGFSDLAAEFPTLKNPFTATHALNALALLSGAAVRKQQKQEKQDALNAWRNIN